MANDVRNAFLMRRALAAFAVALGGCDQFQQNQTPPPITVKQAAPPAKAGQANSNSGSKAKSEAPKRPQPAAREPDRERAVPSGPLRTVGRAEAAAMRKVATVIKESLEVGPTLVLWVMDRTPSARKMVEEMSAAAQNYYESPEVQELSATESNPLLTALVVFDEQAEIKLDPPTGDWQQVVSAFRDMGSATTGREMTFGALKLALEKFLPLRTKDRREIVVIVVTDEAGDDAAAVDGLIEVTRRNAIPVYVVGLPAPWGQTNPYAANPKATSPEPDDSVPTVGPESALSERVDIENWLTRRDARASSDLIDSGFGPHALERLCRASRGQFIAIRPHDGFGYGGIGGQSWPPGGELRFDETVVSKYVPDYVSRQDYQRLLTENKARAALCEAAKLPKVSIEGTPGSRFPKAAEAKMAKQFSQAQQFAARNSPPVDHLYDVLSPGEQDRAKLTSPRWQAEFDLAMGRVLAVKARLDGYNSMIAALKRGKTFQNADSKTWVLESADVFETESTVRKLAERAKTYLERVVKEHPGTPWARIAEEELRLPLGWAWKESP